MRYVSLIGIAGLAVAGGCAPLEQAPLVYSSTKQFGVGVKSGAPDAPGLDLNIGFRALDAAYVPVAVAKPCPQVGTCNAAAHDIMRITGVNEVSGLSSVDEERIASYTKIIDDSLKAIEERSRRKGIIVDQLKEIRNLGTMRGRLAVLEGAAAEVPPRTLTAQEESELVQLRAQINRVSALNESDLNAEVAKIDADNAAAGRVVDDTRELRKPLLAQRNEQKGDQKSDALSVYGTFNGDSTGNAQGGSLKLGNTFSTGIAAQNITQGLRQSAPLKAMQECLSATKHILDDADIPAASKAVIVQGIVSACGGGIKIE